MAQQYIFQTRGLKKIVDNGRVVIEDISLSFYPGAKIGVIGVNGSGKSTLLKIMAGIDEDFLGHAWRDPGARVGYLPQEPQLDDTLDVRGNIELAVKETRDLLNAYEACSARFAEELTDDEMDKLIEEQSRLQDEIDASNAWELDRQLDIAMDALRVPDPEASVEHLSGGERRRVALCQLLLSRPDMLLLDEPTNHLDAESVAWLERHLQEYEGTVILVTHDRYFLDRVATRMLEVFHGEIRTYEGNYSDFLEAKEKQQEIQDRTDANLLKAVARELEWIRSTPQARRTKSKARIAAYEDLVEKASRIAPADELDLRIPFGPRLGNKVVSLRGVKKAYDGKVLMDGFDFDMPPGAIIGITGANGLGKTTLVNMIVGREEPDDGVIEVGETTNFCYVDQTRQTLRDELTVYEEVADGSDVIEYGDKTLSVRHYLARFLFSGSIQQTEVGRLSGGERNRLQLAKMLRQPSNFIILDEPTNDLDLMTLRVLEEALSEYPGCAMVITHDRYFLDRVATHILGFEGDAEIEFCSGDWDFYVAQREKRLAERGGSKSQKFKHRKL